VRRNANSYLKRVYGGPVYGGPVYGGPVGTTGSAGVLPQAVHFSPFHLFVSQHNSVWLTMILIGSGVCSCMLYVAFYKSIQIFFIFWILDLKFGTHVQEPIAPRCFWIWQKRTISSPRIDQKSAGFDLNMLMQFLQLPGKLNIRDFFGYSGSCITLPPLPTFPHDILKEKNKKKPIEIDEKRLRNFNTLKNTLNLSLEFFLWSFMFLHHPAPPLTPLLTRF
jgi:hypothetical protein